MALLGGGAGNGTIANALAGMGAPDPGAQRLCAAMYETMVRLLAAAGADWGRAASTHGAFRETGLVDVSCTGHVESWPSGGDGCEMLRVHVLQLREPILALGLISAEELDRWFDLLREPSFTLAAAGGTSRSAEVLSDRNSWRRSARLRNEQDTYRWWVSNGPKSSYMHNLWA